MTELSANKVAVRAGDAALLEDVSMSLRPGELVAVLGPNGAGKTTLLRVLLGQQKVQTGSATIDGTPVADLSAAQRARSIAYLPQRRPLAWPNTVRDIVALGRFAHGAALGRLGPVDCAAVNVAIEACDLAHLANRHIDNLSGGELARVHFARVIAAQTPLLIADEPVAELDPRHQLGIAQLIRDYVNDGGGALVVLHEIGLAARIADRLIWMKNGRKVADGTPRETLTEKRLSEIYGVRARVSDDSGEISVRVDGIAQD
ncbi:MAG: ABC transporter ATP-binding protein [Woeseiaceae bacterium]